jgi:hypothetical protein
MPVYSISISPLLSTGAFIPCPLMLPSCERVFPHSHQRGEGQRLGGKGCHQVRSRYVVNNKVALRVISVIVNLRISVPDPDWIRNQAGQNRPPKNGKN